MANLTINDKAIKTTNGGNILVHNSDLPNGTHKRYPFDKIKNLNNVVIVNSLEDLPTPLDISDGFGAAYHLIAETGYLFGTDLILTNPIVIPNGAILLQSVISTRITWNGVGALYNIAATNPDASVQIFNIETIGNGSNTIFDLQEGSFLGLFRAAFNNANLGTISNIDLITYERTNHKLVQGGLTFINCQTMYMRAVAFQAVAPFGNSYISISGTTFSSVFTNCQFVPIAGDAAFFIDPTIIGFIDILGCNVITAYGGTPFYTGSIDKTDLRVIANANRSISDSDVIGSLVWINNLTETVIDDQNTWYKITGTTHPAQNERCSQTDNNQLTFTNLEYKNKNVRFRLDVIRGAGAGAPTFQFRIHKNSLPIQINANDIIASVDTNDSIPVNVVLEIPEIIVSGDVFEIWVCNISNTSNCLILNGTFVIN